MRPRDAEKVVCDCSANVPRMEFGPKIAWSSGRAGLSSSSWTATPDIDGRDRSFWSSASRGGPSRKLASTILRAGASVVASTTRGARYSTPRAHTPLTLPLSMRDPLDRSLEQQLAAPPFDRLDERAGHHVGHAAAEDREAARVEALRRLPGKRKERKGAVALGRKKKSPPKERGTRCRRGWRSRHACVRSPRVLERSRAVRIP